MTISVVVEDGTGIASANSYVSVEFAREYAANRGVVLGDDDTVAAFLITATDYLSSFEFKFVGHRTTEGQSLSWPRTDAYYGSGCFRKLVCGPNDIPTQIKSAQCQAVIAQASGLTLLPNISPTDFVTEETVGPITTKYADPISAGIRPVLSAVDIMLQPLLSVSSGRGLKTVRV